jgi:hypothetical protein
MWETVEADELGQEHVVEGFDSLAESLRSSSQNLLVFNKVAFNLLHQLLILVLHVIDQSSFC